MVLIRLALASKCIQEIGAKPFWMFLQNYSLCSPFSDIRCNKTHLFLQKRRIFSFATERCMMFICDPIER